MTRRRVLGALPAVALTSGLTAGCAGAQPATRRTPLLVRVLAENTAGRQARAGAWHQRFEAHRGVRVFVDSSANLADPGRPPRAATLAPLLASNPRVADLVLVDFMEVPALAARGALRSIEPLVQRDHYDLKRFMPAGLQPAYGLDGHLHGLPEEVDARQLYFNRAHFTDASVDFRRAGFDFENPAMTWDALHQVALDLLAAPRGRDRLPFHPGQPGATLELWGWQNGGEWLDRDGRHVTFTRPENVAALEWLASMARELGGLFSPEQFPPPARLGGGADRAEMHPFVTGRTSICVESTRFVSTCANAPIDFALGYAELPRRFPAWRLLTTTNTSGYVVTRDAPDEAWDALRFLVSEDAALVDAWASVVPYPKAPPLPPGVAPGAAPEPGEPLWFPAFTGQLAIDRKLAAMFRTGAKLLDEARDHGLEQLRHGYPRPRTLAPDAVWGTLEDARRAALLGGSPPAEALRDGQRAAQQTLDAAGRAVGGA